MAEPLVGRALRRREDPPLLRGDATYTDDLAVPGMAHAAILRSRYGHATIESVDPDRGEVAIERYVAVDDCGVVINPLVVAGQIHGGVAQGIGQARYEDAVYDDTGSLLSGTFQDYALPRAAHLPELETHETVTPSPHNPLGVKGTGESGTIAATPAVANAVVDALQPFGVDDLDLPMTPETVWRAIRAAD